jgi:hypothetical protein
MDDPNVLIPEFDETVHKTTKQILAKEEVKSVAEKTAESIAALRGVEGWANGLRPYIEERIKRLKEMSEVNLDGKETMAEIGLRFTISSAIASELNDLLVKVDATTKVVEERKDSELKQA